MGIVFGSKVLGPAIATPNASVYKLYHTRLDQSEPLERRNSRIQRDTLLHGDLERGLIKSEVWNYT